MSAAVAVVISALAAPVAAFLWGYVLGMRNEARWWSVRQPDVQKIPAGMVSVTIAGKPPVLVPVNTDEIESLGRLVEIVKRGPDRPVSP